MTSSSPHSLGLIGLAFIAQAAAFPQATGTPATISKPTATVSFGSTGSKSTGMAIGIIVAMVVVLIVICCGCGGLAWFLCARHKRKREARLNKRTSPSSVGTAAQQSVRLAEIQQTNVVGPSGQHGQPGYFDQHQQGYNTGLYDHEAEPKFNNQTPNMSTGSPLSTPGTPAPPYSQPHQTGNHPPMPTTRPQVYEMDSNPDRLPELG